MAEIVSWLIAGSPKPGGDLTLLGYPMFVWLSYLVNLRIPIPLAFGLISGELPLLYPAYAVVGGALAIAGLVLWNRLLHNRAEQSMLSLKESEARFRAVLQNVGLVAVILDTQGRVTLCSEFLLKLTGWSRSEVIGEDWFDRFLPVDIRQRINRHVFQQLLRDGKIAPVYENEIVTRDGRRRMIAWSNTVISDLAGNIAGVASIGVDITEHLQATKRAQHLANFPELNPNPVLEFSSSGELLYRNPAAAVMARQVGQEDIHSLLPADTMAVVRECLQADVPRLRLTSQHGKHHLSWSFYPIKTQGVVHCYAGDITERQLMEERLRQKQKMEAIGQLSGGVAHDFNNLLTVIIGHVDLLRTTEGLKPEIAESIDEIGGAASRAANLTRQLLAFSRHQVMTPQELDLNQVISQVHKILRRVLGEDVTIDLGLSAEPQPFRGDASMIEQVLLNLAVNARDAMLAGGTLRIATATVRDVAGGDGVMHTGTFVKMTVADTGKGIPAQILPRIFDPFFTTKEVGKGTGLGLAMVFGVMEQHQGWIEVTSTMGQGATFDLYLPRIEVALAAKPLDQLKSANKGRGETILFVEDEPSVRELGVLALRRRGYQVLTAANGAEALAVWTEHKAKIALLLTDIIMPGGMTGLLLAKQLLAENPQLRVIYSSGYSAEIAGKELPMEDGVNYLGKPYELQRLFETVRSALDGNLSRPPF